MSLKIEEEQRQTGEGVEGRNGKTATPPGQLLKSIASSDEIKQQILKTGIRKVERKTKVSHHTINRILKGENVRRKTLAKIIKGI